MPNAAPAKVLVVDDEDNITFLLSTALRHFGFEVETAADGRTALSAARRGGHDTILLDVMLPDLDGFEIVRRLRADGVRTPVLFLTARERHRGHRAGPDPRRRRLRDQAVQPGGGGRPRAGAAAPQRAAG